MFDEFEAPMLNTATTRKHQIFFYIMELHIISLPTIIKLGQFIFEVFGSTHPHPQHIHHLKQVSPENSVSTSEGIQTYYLLTYKASMTLTIRTIYLHTLVIKHL